MKVAIGLLLLSVVYGINACQHAPDSEMSSLVGPHPTAVHAAVQEFNQTILVDPQYDIPQVKKVKLATRKFDSETPEKVFVDIHYQVIYQNDAYLFCGLLYSWNKKTELVLLEKESPCEEKGEIPDLSSASEEPKPRNEREEPRKTYDPTDDEKTIAVKQVEAYFVSETPAAELSSAQVVGQHTTHAEVEVEFSQTDGGEVLACKSLYGYDFVSKKTFIIETGDCHPQ